MKKKYISVLVWRKIYKDPGSYTEKKYIVKEIPFQRIITGFIAIAEVKSILENYNTIYGVNPFRALVNLIKLTRLKLTINKSKTLLQFVRIKSVVIKRRDINPPGEDPATDRRKQYLN